MKRRLVDCRPGDVLRGTLSREAVAKCTDDDFVVNESALPARRRFLGGVGLAGAVVLLAGHTPFRQWAIYRQRFLLIHTSREDLGGDSLGDGVAAALLRNLPSSRAQVVRGPNSARIASLLSTGQADVAVLTRHEALALTRSSSPFQDYTATALRVLVENDSHQLVCRVDFPGHHGYLIAEALMADGPVLGVSVPDRESGENIVPTHAGALAYARGLPLDPP